ncbi:hypothetical protein EK904_010033 [Melospiza melodia maxima]|nr:hypothetical protein EK904_010033 [Melospiza melodia maxima]
MATGARSITLRAPPSPRPPVQSVEVTRMIMKKSNRSVLSLPLKKKSLLPSKGLKVQLQMTYQISTPKPTGLNLSHCQRQKRKCDNKHKPSKQMWFLLM